MKRKIVVSEYDVIVVGGGASGCIAAGYAAQNGNSVLVIERNKRPARKILVTGKGRCNLTNNCEPQEFFKHVRSNPKFIFSAISRFTPQSTINLFESLGVKLKTERGRRVFPESDRAMDIADALQLFIKNKNITLTEGHVTRLLVSDGSINGVMTDDGTIYGTHKVIISTGGLSYPATGSTGDGYELARQAGHTVTETRGSLVGITTEEDMSDASGLSLKNVTLRLYFAERKKPLYEELGEMLITHEGISGPLVLTASTFMDGDISQYRIELDLKPGLSEEELDARILRDFGSEKNKDFENSLDALIPKSFIGYIVKQSGIAGDIKVNQITRQQRQSLVNAIKKYRITPVKLDDVETAVITAGGVRVSEINPKTMESKIQKGLYFAGEVMDVDAETGGYNLQIAFSTGYAAGSSV